MPLPASEHVPVEVWLQILHFALVSPLSPDTADDIIDCRNVFLTGCDSDQAALMHEKNVASFCLVCQSWDATVMKLQQRMTLYDFGMVPKYRGRTLFEAESLPLCLVQEPIPEKLPLVTRVEFWTPEMECYCFHPTCQYKRPSTARDQLSRDLRDHSLVACHSGKSVSTVTSGKINFKTRHN